MPRNNPRVLSVPIALIRIVGLMLDIVLLAIGLVAYRQGNGNAVTYIAVSSSTSRDSAFIANEQVQFVFSFLTNAFDLASFSGWQIWCSPSGGDMCICDLITLGPLIGDAIVWTWHFCIYETSSDICVPVVPARVDFGIALAMW